MNRKEIEQLMETIDVLRMLARKGSAELSHLADYMMAWGGYIFFNMLSVQFLGRGFWGETLFIPPMIALSRTIGWLKSVLIWVWGYIIMYGTYFLTHSVTLTIIATVIAFITLTIIGYTISRQGNEKPFVFTLSPYVGITWGVIWTSLWFLIALFPPEDSSFLNALANYGVGIGLFITGILHRGFILMGIYALFVLPLILKFLPGLYPTGYALIGLMMMAIGYHIRRQND